MTIRFVTCFMIAGCAIGGNDTTSGDQDIVGGFPARSEKFDAIGMLYGVRSTGPAPICSGTLIGPHTVLTAGHCVHPSGAPFNIIDRFPVFFAIGYDSAAPTKRVRAVWGGETTVAGNDVGVYELEEDVEGVTPIAFSDAPLTDADIGKKAWIAGYGLQDSGQNFLQFLTRRAAKFDITTFEAKPLAVMFPDFATFKTFMETNAGKSFTDAQVSILWDLNEIRPGDVWVGKPNAPQASYLDSGAPLLLNVDDVLTIEGVNVRSYRADPTVPTTGTNKDMLPVGSAVAMVGIDGTREFVDHALTDPCRNVTSNGHCSATLAVRCPAELPTPIVTTLDCADLGTTCAVDASGVAGCQ